MLQQLLSRTDSRGTTYGTADDSLPTRSFDSEINEAFVSSNMDFYHSLDSF